MEVFRQTEIGGNFNEHPSNNEHFQKKTYLTNETDNELVKQILDGKKTALTTLVERHQLFIYNLAWKLTGNISDAENLTKETLMKIISGLSTFKQ